MMKLLVFIVVIIGISAFGFAQQTIYGSFTHDDMEREYILYVPENYTGNEKVPLILNYHGYGSNAGEQMNYGDFRSISDTAGFLVVHPEGTLLYGITHWNVGGWTIGSTVDDVGFSQALIDTLSADYNIDSTRVYATGMSNGGFMSFLLACQLSDRLAAIASVTGSMTPETYMACNAVHPMPILQMHGTSDQIVPYVGAIWSKPIEEVLQYWVSNNNCINMAYTTPLPDLDTNDGSTVEHIAYYNGDNNTSVEHYKISGGGHTWPGNMFGGPGTNYDIDGSVEIWKFFRKYDIYGGTGTIISTDQHEFNDQPIMIYPNPAGDYVYIKGDFQQVAEYKIFAPGGQCVIEGIINSDEHQIKLSQLPRNLYIILIGNRAFKILKIN